MKPIRTARRIAGNRSFEQYRRALLGDPSVRDWVKRAITELERRDPVDAAHDIDMLVTALLLRVEGLSAEPMEQADSMRVAPSGRTPNASVSRVEGSGHWTDSKISHICVGWQQPKEAIVLKGDFSAGKPVPLSIPSCVRREWRINGVEGERLKDCEAEIVDSVGYEFEWGQIIESLTDPHECEEACEPGYPGAQWHFLLTDLHDAFLDAGGNLGELSDLALILLDEVTEDALAQLPPELRHDAETDYIEYDEGNDACAFAVLVYGIRNVGGARHWVDSFFIPRVLPLLISQLHAENKAASFG